MTNKYKAGGKLLSPQTSIIKMYSTVVDNKEFVREYMCKSELEVLNAELDYYSKLVLVLDGCTLEGDFKQLK